jgi:hypothetical protein
VGRLLLPPTDMSAADQSGESLLPLSLLLLVVVVVL